MGMNIGKTTEPAYMEMVRRDLKRIEKKGTSRAETLDDIRDTTGKSFRTSDLEKLMEKYDPEAYEKYSMIAKDADGARTTSGMNFLSNWLDGVRKGVKDGSVSAGRTSDISAQNEEKLSEKAQEFLKNLRKKYGDYDFFVGNSTDDLKSLAKSGGKEFSVIFSSEELERMANDEKYAEEKMRAVEGAVKMSKKICEQNGFKSAFGNGKGENGTINKISIAIGDDGSMKIFAELEKVSDKQKERIEKAREKRAEEKRADRKNPYRKEEEPAIKRTTVEASSAEELLEKIGEIDWSKIAESHSGDRFNFMA